MEQRILVKEETYVNLAQDSYVWGTTHFTTSDGIQLYLSVGMKKVDYKGGKNSCDIIFGAYMDNTVNFMDWRSSQDHTYEQVDSKPVRFPYNLGYEAKDPAQKEGYTFMGWYDEQGYRFEKDSIIKEDLNVYAKYVKNSEKKVYTVNHYTEQLNGEYKNYESKKNQASNNQLILAESMIKTGLTGFIFNAEKSDKSIVAGQDDELNLYYDRDIKTVTFMNGNETLSVKILNMRERQQCQRLQFVKDTDLLNGIHVWMEMEETSMSMIVSFMILSIMLFLNLYHHINTLLNIIRKI